MPFPNLDGRPVEYTEEVVKKLPEYLQWCKDNESLPKRAGFAVYIGVSKSTLWEWEQKERQLSNALKELDSIQENQIIDNALVNKYNAVISKLLLSNHGYSDKSQVDQTVKATVEEKPDMDTKEKIDYLMSKLEEQKKLLNTGEAGGSGG